MDDNQQMTPEVIRLELKKVFDPDIHENIVDVGLIYDIQITDVISILITLTTPLCPSGPTILQDIRNALEKFKKPVEVKVTFEPAWSPKLMSEEVRDRLGLDEDGNLVI